MKELKNIPGLDPEEVVKIAKFKFGDKAKITNECTFINPTNPEKSRMDLGIYKIATMKFGIVEAPFFTQGCKKEEVIENLDGDTGEFIFREICNYNKMGNLEELKKN